MVPKGKKQKHGFPIEDLGNDGGGGFPECLYYPLFVTPEWSYQGSIVFKKHGCLAKFQA